MFTRIALTAIAVGSIWVAEAFACVSDGDCKGTRVCNDGRCQANTPQCTSDSQCPGDLVCESGKCVTDGGAAGSGQTELSTGDDKRAVNTVDKAAAPSPGFEMLKAPEPQPAVTVPAPPVEAVAPEQPMPAVSSKVIGMLADDSLAKSTRKVAFAPRTLGRGHREVTADYTVCRKNGDSTQCSPGTPMRFSLSTANIDNATDELHAWVVTQRLDRVRIIGNRAEILVKNRPVNIEISSLSQLNANHATAEAFAAESAVWLNRAVGPIMKPLLNDSLVERYKNLPDRERQTFITERAKEVGMPAVFVQKLMNSAFSFTMFMAKPEASYTLSEGTRTAYVNGNKVEVPVWTASITLDGEVELTVSRYNPATTGFELYETFTGESGSTTFSKSFDNRQPSSSEVRALFDEAHTVMAKAIGINLNYQLMGDENFAIIFPARSVEDSNVDGDVGAQEDIRVDMPVAISRVIDGVRVHQGYGKARVVAENCNTAQGKQAGSTQFEIIKGDSEVGDRVQVYPWVGVLMHGGAGTLNYSVQQFDLKTPSFEETYSGLTQVGGEAIGGHFGLKLDLGFVTNSHALSEFWTGMDFFFGEAQGDYILDAGLSFSKRLYVGAGIYLEPGVAFSFTGLLDDTKVLVPKSDGGEPHEEQFAFMAITGTPSIDLGYNFSPDVELVANAGWSFPFFNAGGYGADDDGIEVDNVEAKGGLRLMVALNIHFSAVGGLARYYARPSEVCRTPDLEAKPAE
ncbi:MAG: EB domain-containing protein [Bradymonadia bacterium]